MLRQHTYNEIKGVSTEEKEASVSNNRFRDFFSTPSFFLFDRQRVVCDTEKPMGEGNDRIWAVVTGLRVHRNNLGPICISIGHPIISLSRKKKKNRKKGEKKKIKIPPPASSLLVFEQRWKNNFFHFFLSREEKWITLFLGGRGENVIWARNFKYFLPSCIWIYNTNCWMIE